MAGANSKSNDSTLGFEATLWAAADKLRGHMDAAEYKHVVLGLIFLKYISDAFEEHHAAVETEYGSEAAEDRDEYTAEGIFWVPKEARWADLKANAKQPDIGSRIDAAMEALERENRTLKDVLPKGFARPTLNKEILGGLIDQFSNLGLGSALWGGERLRQDGRWQYGTPPVGNANYAWVQHMIYHLAQNGIAGFVLANGSLSSNTSGEGEIRKAIIEADLVDCIVALPGQLFYTTQIPVSLWFLAKNKRNGRGMEGKLLRDRSGQTLFIDARKLGFMETRVNRNLSPEDIGRIALTYHNWRGDGGGNYEDVAGFCRSASTEEIRGHGYVLTPGRYVGAEAVEDDGEPFGEKMARLTKTLEAQFAEGETLQAQIRENLRRLGYGG